MVSGGAPVWGNSTRTPLRAKRIAPRPSGQLTSVSLLALPLTSVAFISGVPLALSFACVSAAILLVIYVFSRRLGVIDYLSELRSNNASCLDVNAEAEPSGQKIVPLERCDGIVKAAEDIHLTDSQLLSLYYLLLEENYSRVRVAEKIDNSQHTMMRAAKLDVRLPHDGLVDPSESKLLLPIMKPTKGQYIRGLVVKDDSGTTVSTLNHETTNVALTRLASELLMRALGPSKDNPVAKSDVRPLLNFFITELLSYVVSDSGADPRHYRDLGSARNMKVERRSTLAAQADQLLSEHHFEVIDEPLWKGFKTLVGLVSMNYVIIALCRPEHFVHITYELEPFKTHISRPNMGVRDKISSMLAMLLNSEGHRIQVSANRGNSASSYHLSVCFPTNAYVGGYILRDSKGAFVKRVPNRLYDDGLGYFRLSGRTTQTAHLYARRLKEVTCPGGARPLTLEVIAHERLPGSLGRALLVACGVLVAIMVLSAVPQLENPDLGFPIGLVGIVISVWSIIPRSDGPHITSITSIASLAASILLMISATGHVLFSASPVWVFEPIVGFDLPIVREGWWSVMGYLAVAHVVAVILALWLRTWRYILLERQEVFGVDNETTVN